MQYPDLLEGGSLALRRSLGSGLQLLAQRRQLLRLGRHCRLFLVQQLEESEETRWERWCVCVVGVGGAL